VDESGTISFLISVLVADTDQMITLPVVIFPTDVSLFEYQAYNALAAASSSVDNATQLDAGSASASASGIDTGSFPPAYGYAPTQPQQQSQQSLVDVNLSDPSSALPPPHAHAAHAPFAFPHPRTASLSQPYPFVPLGQQHHMQHAPAPALPAAHAPQQRPYWTPSQPQQQQQLQQQPQQPQTKFVGNEGLFLP
jgi:hypothetical protein